MLRIHDNFDGTWRCVQCNGPCKLTDDDRRVTALVRYIFETNRISLAMRAALDDLGVDVPAFQQRAKHNRVQTQNERAKVRKFRRFARSFICPKLLTLPCCMYDTVITDARERDYPIA